MLPINGSSGGRETAVIACLLQPVPRANGNFAWLLLTLMTPGGALPSIEMTINQQLP